MFNKILTIALMTIVLVFANFSRPVSAELMFHFSFESESTILKDVLGNEAEIRGEPERVNGKVGMGLKFDGEDDYIFTAGEGSGPPFAYMHEAFTEKSVAMWIKADDVNGDHTIFNEGGEGGGYSVRIYKGNLEFTIANDRILATAASDYTNTNWHHIATVYNEGELYLYIDGKEIETEEAPWFPGPEACAHGNECAIGATYDDDCFTAEGPRNKNDNPWNFFQGIIDEVYYYTNALTAREINALVQAAVVESFGRLTTRWGELKALSD